MIRRALGWWVASCGVVGAACVGQPFAPWASFERLGKAAVEVSVEPPIRLDLGFTLEAWVEVADDGICSSVAGNGYRSGWWVGVCGTTLRSFVDGTSGRRDGGEVIPGRWTHVAVSSDRLVRRHYVDGELVATFPESPGESVELGRWTIGSDPDWPFEPTGGIAEVRLWSGARTLGQLQAGLRGPLVAPRPSLLGVWSGPLLGTVVGAASSQAVGDVGTDSLPAGDCLSTPTTACLGDDRFGVEIEWRDFQGQRGVATVAEQSSDSALWWFFAPSNWEMLVKVLDGCHINEAHWVFAAAATTVHFRLTVFDHLRGAQRIYLNPAGAAAVALTDTSAFETCP